MTLRNLPTAGSSDSQTSEDQTRDDRSRPRQHTLLMPHTARVCVTSGSASGLFCSQKRDTLLRAYNLTRAVGREGVVTQRLCEVSGIRRRQVAFCKAGICQSFVLLGRKRIFVVPCQRYELPETIIGGQDSRACVEVVGDEP